MARIDAPIAILALALAISPAEHLAAQAGCGTSEPSSTSDPDAPMRARDKAIVSQICVDPEAGKQVPAELPDAKDGPAADVEQLPDDIEVPDDVEGPEEQMVRAEDSPEKRLYRDIADVWQTIRKRGQQPTPELIAREIGPDNLARFLDQNPGAESAFGQDSDEFPVPGPEEALPPDGGIFALPALDSGP